MSVELSSYEFSFPPSAKASDLSRFSFSDLQDLPRNLVQPVGYISLLMRDGEPTKAARITGGAATGDAKSMRPQDDWKFLPGETGEKLEVRPSLGVLPAGLAPGKVVTVGLDVAYTLRLPPKKPGDEITEVALNAAATVTNDEPAILRIVPSGNEAGKYIAIVARAKWGERGRMEIAPMIFRMFYKTGGPRALFAAFFLSCAGGHAQEPKPAANPLPEIEITVVECTFPANTIRFPRARPRRRTSGSSRNNRSRCWSV